MKTKDFANIWKAALAPLPTSNYAIALLEDNFLLYSSP